MSVLTVGVFIFIFLNVYGQSSDLLINNNSYKQGLSYDELNTACKKYIEMMETETYQLYEEKTRDLHKFPLFFPFFGEKGDL